MRTLLVDNYDSYTYNLYQLLAEVYEKPPVVLYNDDPRWDRLDFQDFDGVVISPGPGNPANSRDFGRSADVLNQPVIPVLGVCLGHQGIGLAAGASIRSAPRPRHGHLEHIQHTEKEIFAGIPIGFTAVRYHSLCIAEPLPAELEAIAWAEDGVIMGVRHRFLPRWGVQFHPESICTEYGVQLVANFRDLALAATPRPVLAVAPRPVSASGPATPATAPALQPPVNAPERTAMTVPLPAVRPPAALPTTRLLTRRIDWEIDTEVAFLALHGTSQRAFWLDSSHVEPGLSRFSFFGNADEDDGEVLTFRVEDDSVLVEPADGPSYLEPGDIFEALGRRTRRQVVGSENLPFDLHGGYVGYFGYELKAYTGSPVTHRSGPPDAVWMRANRFVAVDHLEHRTYLVAAVDEDDYVDSARDWLQRTDDALRRLPAAPPDASPPSAVDDAPISDWLVRSRSQYLADIAECQRQLHAGESYEICLTNQLRMPAPADDLDYYCRLRRINPAPYSALLRLGELTVFCSSPERFIRIDRNRTVETKPIKGTMPRDSDPERDEKLRTFLLDDDKTRAENLMIVDLLRNDLGRICEIGSVQVPRFMQTESYATVHQLVSTIQGVLRPDVHAVECVRTCFPGGSMTGAPKLRTMEIIDTLETESRGVYSGTLGYFGSDGTADLNIVIRTAVRWNDELAVGAGGAIVLDSEPLAEYEEMLLKAAAPLRALPPQVLDKAGPTAHTGHDVR